MKNRRNYYRILQVQPDAPAEIIRASYRTLMKELKNHPDLGGSDRDASLLNEAYEILADPVSRAAYDARLFLEYTKQAGVSSRAKRPENACPVCRRPLPGQIMPGDVCPDCRTPLQSEKADASRAVKPRSVDRIRKSVPVRYYTAWPAKPRPGRMIDFSPKGMRFLCGEEIESGAVLKISCSLFEASGTVSYASEEAAARGECYAIGVRFIAVRFADARGTFLSTSA